MSDGGGSAGVHAVLANSRRAASGGLASLGVLLFAGQVAAEPAAERLAQRVVERAQGADLTLAATMTLTDRSGATRVRRLVVYRRSSGRGEIATLIRFTEPAEIDGTGLLTRERADAETGQWVYLPAFARVRRVDAGRRGGRFADSDFYYEDLRERRVSADRHRLVGREIVDGVTCEVLESRPVDSSTTIYARRISWIDPASLLPLRIDLFEKRDDVPSKRLRVVRRETIQGYWTATETTLTDLPGGHETRVRIDRALYDRTLPESLFSIHGLEDTGAERPYRP